jgi:hypothetical protein
MTRFEKKIAWLAGFVGLMILGGVSVLASKGEVLVNRPAPAETEIVIRIDGFTAYRVPIFWGS